MRIRCPTTVSTTSTSSRSVGRKAREREHRKRQKEQHSRRRADAEARQGHDLDDEHPATRRVRAEHASPYAHGGKRPAATKQELREARMRQMEQEAAARRAEEQACSPLKRGWQFIYNSFMPAFGFSSSGDGANEMPPPPETPTRSRPKKTYNTPGAFPGMTLDSDSESPSPSRSPDVEMGDETQSASPSDSAKATSPDSASFSSTTPSSGSGNRSSFYAFPSTSSAATSTEDFFASRSHTCNTANCAGGCYYNDPDNSFRIFHDCQFAEAEEDVFSREEKEAERSRKRAEDRRKREEEEHERERRETEKERTRRREAEQREQFKRQREEEVRKEKRGQYEADYRYVENIFAPIAEMEMRHAMERGETEEQLRERQHKIWDEWEALIERVRKQREEKERLEREHEKEMKRRKEREEAARKEREEAERWQRHEHKSKSNSKQSRSHPYARSTNANRKRGGLHFEPPVDPFDRPATGGDSPFHRGCRRPNFKKPNFGASRAKAGPKPTSTAVPQSPASPTPGRGSSSKKYSKNSVTYFEWYESEWATINSLQSTTPLTFKDIPWALVQMPYLPDQVTPVGVKAFMTSKHSSFATTGSKRLTTREKRLAAKKELMNWHPDKFATRVLERVMDAGEREVISRAADVVQKALTDYMREPAD